MSRLSHFLGFMLVCLMSIVSSSAAADPAGSFEAANKLYEQGKFQDAIQAYQQLIQAGQGTATVYFNLGNAFFKAGQNGRAIAAYREAQRLTPRDPTLRYNLEFVRKKATGSEAAPFPAWKRFLSTLTLDEWTSLAAGAYWLWFALLALREVRPAWKRALGGYTATAGASAVLLMFFLWAADAQQNRTLYAVVTAPNAVMHWSPIEKSDMVAPAPEGTELTVVDVNNDKSWLQVRNSARRLGWIPTEQVAVLSNRTGLAMPKPQSEPSQKTGLPTQKS